MTVTRLWLLLKDRSRFMLVPALIFVAYILFMIGPDLLSNRPYSISTTDCVLPGLDVKDEKVKRLRQYREIRCNNVNKSLTYVDGSFLRINTKVKPRDFDRCEYTKLFREPNSGDFSFEFGNFKSFKKDFEVDPEDEFMQVECFNKDDLVISQNFHAVFNEKPLVEKRCRNKLKHHKEFSNPSEILNVQIVGLRSVSRMSYELNMPSTRKFLLEEMDAFEMGGYTKIEDNTFLNMIPLLTGKFAKELPWDESMSGKTFDKYNFIWNSFSDAGYRTFYAEDMPTQGIFVSLKKGFLNPPTDYYMRTLSLALEEEDFVWNNYHHCLQDRSEVNMYLNSQRQFSKLFENKPNFGFSFMSRLPSDDVGYVRAADNWYENFFRQFRYSGLSNNTVLFLLSDQGLKHPQGKNRFVEKTIERLPMMSVAFPYWFIKKYPELVQNLRTNSQRLTTAFDVYETMKNILYLDGKNRKASWNKRGISLLSEIPKSRSCEEAGIAAHWCLCQEQIVLPVSHEISERIGPVFVSKINGVLSPFHHVCKELKLQAVKRIIEMKPSEKVLRFWASHNEVLNRHVEFGEPTESYIYYRVTVSTSPGYALLEATLVFDPQRNYYGLVGDINRLNPYGKYSKCVDIDLMKKLCFCKF